MAMKYGSNLGKTGVLAGMDKQILGFTRAVEEPHSRNSSATKTLTDLSLQKDLSY